ncbi:MAG: acyl-CoA dehydrogenase family protein [Deltaproteobacteria bacterium]|nr:MAG: acyl-CoA dehydrogenase family protein [Deltaproteobacteria bacterium]
MREFAESAIRSVARECDEASSLPDDFLNTAWELGLTTTQIPSEYGGEGEARSPITNVLILEELAFGDAALAAAAVCPSLFANAIVDQGSEEQKRAYLPLFTTPTYHVGSLAIVEPDPAFDAFFPRCTAEPKGEGFVVSGRKSFVPLADRASHFLVLARVGNGAGNGPDAFIVPRDAKGLQIGETEKNLGLRALPTATVDFERVELGPEARLGGEAGCDVRRIINGSRTALAAAMVGLSRAVMEYAIPYAQDRVAFGEAIAQKQAIAFMLADMRIETDCMRWLVWRAASQLERGADATAAAHQARAYAARRAMKIADDGVQVLGGHGYIREHPVELWYRNARMLGVLEGMFTC